MHTLPVAPAKGRARSMSCDEITLSSIIAGVQRLPSQAIYSEVTLLGTDRFAKQQSDHDNPSHDAETEKPSVNVTFCLAVGAELVFLQSQKGCKDCLISANVFH